MATFNSTTTLSHIRKARPHQKAFEAYLRSGDDDALQELADLGQEWDAALIPCRKCQTPMKRGLATGQTYTGGMPDFPSDKHASTFSAGGPGKLIECWKCPACGWSMT